YAVLIWNGLSYIRVIIGNVVAVGENVKFEMTVTLALAKKKPAAKPKAKASSAKPTAKPNPTPKAMPAANNSNKPARQRKRSARLITVEEISRHYGKSFEEAADILGEHRRLIALQCRGIDSPLS
ncbi:hypothetical protein Tco_0962212, partial [Tanacetum coccineum]